jgi:uncharacterized protein (TIGR02757 family)
MRCMESDLKLNLRYVAKKKVDLVLLKEFLDEKAHLYNNRSFIDKDPISIPHQFSRKEDIEISGFLAATISWGNRAAILKNANRLTDLMDRSPHDFVLHHTPKDLERLNTFVHRTFNGEDCKFFVRALRNIYVNEGGMEKAFASETGGSLKDNIIAFRNKFIGVKHEKRSEKHISDPGKKSSAKRLCMYLRWMVRKDKRGVDFGIWNSLTSSQLCLPLDVHTGNVSRKLGILQRKQNDWVAVEEVTSVLRMFDPKDPVKYDFALFGLGVDKKLDEL